MHFLVFWRKFNQLKVLLLCSKSLGWQIRSDVCSSLFLLLVSLWNVLACVHTQSLPNMNNVLHCCLSYEGSHISTCVHFSSVMEFCLLFYNIIAFLIGYLDPVIVLWGDWICRIHLVVLYYAYYKKKGIIWSDILWLAFIFYDDFFPL